MELGCAALDLLDSAADLGAPFGTELDWPEATAQRAHELFKLLLGQRKATFRVTGLYRDLRANLVAAWFSPEVESHGRRSVKREWRQNASGRAS